MAYNQRDPGTDGSTSAWSFTHTRSLAVLVLAALVVLWALRHVFGSVHVSAGVN